MTLGLAVADRADAPVEVMDQLNGFDRLADDGIDGVIWNRSLLQETSQAMGSLQLWESQDSRFTSPIQDLGTPLKQALDAVGVDEAGVRDWLIQDVQVLAAKLADLLDTEFISVRTEIVCHDGCTKFHQGAIKARMICTYVGPGTEYTAPGLNIQSVATGCPMLLKGKAWSTRSQPILKHRSPPIEGTGQGRLVIVIDDAEAVLAKSASPEDDQANAVDYL